MNNLDDLINYILEQIKYYINVKENEIRQVNNRPLYLWLAANQYDRRPIELNDHQVYTIISQVKKLNYDEIKRGMLKFENIMHDANNITGNEVYIAALNIFKECELIRTIDSIIDIRKMSNSRIQPKNKILRVINTMMKPFSLPTNNMMTKMKSSTTFTVTFKKILNK